MVWSDDEWCNAAMRHNDIAQTWLEAAVGAARAAGEAIMAVYATDFEVQAKADASPVTAADEGAENIIVPRLRALDGALPIVAEEAVAAGRMPRIGADFWLVDPLDGTREFIRRNGEFTVNIALIRDRKPLLGVVFAPALGAAGRMFAGVVGACAWLDDGAGRRAIRCREVPAEGATVVASRSHGDRATEAWLRGVRVQRRVSAGSSLKFGLVAAGEADLYPRFGRTMEWDIAAGHAVLCAAGGEVVDLSGAPIGYAKPGLENPPFIARRRS